MNGKSTRQCTAVCPGAFGVTEKSKGQSPTVTLQSPKQRKLGLREKIQKWTTRDLGNKPQAWSRLTKSKRASLTVHRVMKSPSRGQATATSPKTRQELYLKTCPTEPGLQTRICHNLSERSASDQTPLGYRIRVLKAGKGSKLQPTGLSTALSRAQLHANSKTGLNPKRTHYKPDLPYNPRQDLQVPSVDFLNYGR